MKNVEKDGEREHQQTAARRCGGGRRWIAIAVVVALALGGGGAWWALREEGFQGTTSPGDRPFRFGLYRSAEERRDSAAGPPAAPDGDRARLAAAMTAALPSSTPAAAQERATLLADLLSDAMGRPVEVRLFDRHVDLSDALAGGEVDAARLSPYDYVSTLAQAEISPIFQEIRYGESAYKAQFITVRGSGIDSLADLAGKRVAFPDPTSVSGYMLPVAFLERQGLSVHSMELVFSGSHANVIRDVLVGEVGAGVTFAKAEKLWENDAQPAGLPGVAAPLEELHVFAETDGLPHGIIAARVTLPEQDRLRLAEALQEIADSPAGGRLLQTWWSVDGFTPTNPDSLALLKATLAMLPS